MNDFTSMQYIGASIIAAMIGFLTGIFGVGGGFLMTPALIILLNIKGNIAVGTDLAIILFNSTVGIIKRKGTDTVDTKLACWLATGGIAGSQIGIYLLNHLKNAPVILVFGKEHDPVLFVLLSLFLILLTWVAVFMSYDLKKSQYRAPDIRTGLFEKIRVAPYRNFHSLEHPKMSLFPIIVFGFCRGNPDFTDGRRRRGDNTAGTDLSDRSKIGKSRRNKLAVRLDNLSRFGNGPLRSRKYRCDASAGNARRRIYRHMVRHNDRPETKWAKNKNVFHFRNNRDDRHGSDKTVNNAFRKPTKTKAPERKLPENLTTSPQANP